MRMKNEAFMAHSLPHIYPADNQESRISYMLLLIFNTGLFCD